MTDPADIIAKQLTPNEPQHRHRAAAQAIIATLRRHGFELRRLSDAEIAVDKGRIAFERTLHGDKSRAND